MRHSVRWTKKVEFREVCNVYHTQNCDLSAMEQCSYHAAVKQQIIFIMPS